MPNQYSRSHPYSWGGAPSGSSSHPYSSEDYERSDVFGEAQGQHHYASSSHPRPTSSSRSEPFACPLSPKLTYTFDDEEPEYIPIEPAPWNVYSTRVNREQLERFFTEMGLDTERVKAGVAKAFEAQAPQHRAGEARPDSSAFEAYHTTVGRAKSTFHAEQSHPVSYGAATSSSYHSERGSKRRRSPTQSPPSQRRGDNSHRESHRRFRDAFQSRCVVNVDDDHTREAEINVCMEVCGDNRESAVRYVDWQAQNG